MISVQGFFCANNEEGGCRAGTSNHSTNVATSGKDVLPCLMCKILSSTIEQGLKTMGGFGKPCNIRLPISTMSRFLKHDINMFF